MSVFIRRHGDNTKKYLFKNGLCSGIAWSTQESEDNGTAEVSSVIYVGGYTFDIINGWGKASISTPIDITRFSKLKVHITEDEEGMSSFAGSAAIRIGTAIYGSNYEKDISYDATNSTVTMNISAIRGSKYISLYASAEGYESGLAMDRFIKADKVWLEV